MFRIKSLATALKLPPATVQKELTLKHRRKVFCKFDDVWYQFPKIKEVIIPASAAVEFAEKKKKKLHIPWKISDLKYHNIPGKDPVSLPIVAILGHFNHGKTTLLDNYGKTNIVDHEIHAITQVVRTRLLPLSPRTNVTFVDTPGQEIFYRMRDYGASIANLAVLIVAANDGICLQTEESIGIVEALGIPVVVCINKIDLPEVVALKNRLKEIEAEGRSFVALENAPFVPISAKKGTNINVLSQQLEKIIQDLSRQPNETESLENLAEIQRLGISGHGTVLNILRGPQGTELHTIVQQGQVHVGCYFSAGGWSGTVRRITHDNNISLKSASSGYGVHLIVGLHKEAADPRPLGDRIFFHALVKGKDRQTREKAEYVMEQNQMALKLGTYAITPEQVVDFRVEEALLRVRKQKHMPSGGIQSASDEELDEDEERDDDVTSEEDMTSSDGELDDDDMDDVDHEVDEEEVDAERGFSVLVKADTDMTLGTITDGHTDAEEAYFDSLREGAVSGAADSEGGEERKVLPPRKLIYGGVGDVRMRDVTIAQAAKAAIVTYGVGCDKEAARQAQNANVKIMSFECVQDAISMITNKFVQTTTGEDIINLVTKPKRRDTKHD